LLGLGLGIAADISLFVGLELKASIAWAWTRHCSRHLPLGGARTQGFD